MQDEMRTTMFMEDNPAEVQKGAVAYLSYLLGRKQDHTQKKHKTMYWNMMSNDVKVLETYMISDVKCHWYGKIWHAWSGEFTLLLGTKLLSTTPVDTYLRRPALTLTYNLYRL